MNQRFSEELFLTNETGRYLYHTYAEHMPIIDYHCHLLPKEIYENKQFEDIGEMWLAHDHYKWRAMRTFGIDEKYITGDASFYDKFIEFAKILPQMIGNPIYIWCALELKRYFDIEEPLSENNAEEIYTLTKKRIVKSQMTPRWCMEHFNVKVISTTDDPIDTLEYHLRMKEDTDIKTKVLSAFRPDKAFYCEKIGFKDYILKLSQVVGFEIVSFKDMMAALEMRLEFFKQLGTNISDNGIEDFHWSDYTIEEIEEIFSKAIEEDVLSFNEISKYRSAFLEHMGELYCRHEFVMQLHIGTYQGANKSKEKSIGISCGFDCVDDSTPVKSVGELLDRLTKKDMLTKTILYPLNSAQIEPFAILAAAFCVGGIKAKVQLGAPWWFNDQAYGINRQFESIANLYPLSLSVGMLTDSRSFLSYPRHELYRRMLCNYLGSLVERMEYFSTEDELKTIIENICYYNAKDFFQIQD